MTDTLSDLSRRLAKRHAAHGDFVTGLTGSVAVGKTTLAGQIADQLRDTHSVETVSTDGFLFPNDVLNARGLTLRKGFPETYDHAALGETLSDLRSGVADFPGYSHEIFDIDPALTRTVQRPDIFILEGLGFTPNAIETDAAHAPDVLIYIDADEAHILTWFLERFVRFWRAAHGDPSSFYAQWLHMSEAELIEFAKTVWASINQPNLHAHILPLREVADIVLLKDADHRISIAEDRTA